MKNYKIISSQDLEEGTNLSQSEYDYLSELFDLESGDFDVLTLFEGDPDHIKIEGEAGRGSVMFIDVQIEDVTVYILISPEYYGYDYAEAVKILKWFIKGSKNDLISSDGPLYNNWQDWDKVNQGVAYRGGSRLCLYLAR